MTKYPKWFSFVPDSSAREALSKFVTKQRCGPLRDAFDVALDENPMWAVIVALAKLHARRRSGDRWTKANPARVRANHYRWNAENAEKIQRSVRNRFTRDLERGDTHLLAKVAKSIAIRGGNSIGVHPCATLVDRSRGFA